MTAPVRIIATCLDPAHPQDLPDNTGATPTRAVSGQKVCDPKGNVLGSTGDPGGDFCCGSPGEAEIRRAITGVRGGKQSKG